MEFEPNVKANKKPWLFAEHSIRHLTLTLSPVEAERE
jgi:hypothetical protein